MPKNAQRKNAQTRETQRHAYKEKWVSSRDGAGMPVKHKKSNLQQSNSGGPWGNVNLSGITIKLEPSTANYANCHVRYKL